MEIFCGKGSSTAGLHVYAARVSIIPKGDSNNNAVLNRFIHAVVPAVPDATGAALGIYPDFRDVGAQTAEVAVKLIAGETGLPDEGPRKLQSHGRPVRAPRQRQVAARAAARVAARQRHTPVDASWWRRASGRLRCARAATSRHWPPV